MNEAIWTQELMDLALLVGMSKNPETEMERILTAFLDKLDCSVVSVFRQEEPSELPQSGSQEHRTLEDATTPEGSVCTARGLFCNVSIPSWPRDQHPYLHVATRMAETLLTDATRSCAMEAEGTLIHYLYRLSDCGFVHFSRVVPFPLSIEEKLAPIITLLGNNCLSSRASRRLEETEHVLREERNFLHALMDSTPDLIFFKDLKGVYRLANQAVCNLLNLPVAKIIGRTDADLHNENEAKSYELRDLHILSGEQILSHEITYPAANGTYVPFDLQLSPYHNPDGTTTGFIGIARDLTKRKEIESVLARRMDFQNLLMSLATTFVNVPLEDMDTAIQNTLCSAGMFTDSDRAYLFMYDFDLDIMSNTHEWCAEGISAAIDLLKAVPCEPFRQIWVVPHQHGEIVHVPEVDLLPEGDPLKEILSEQGIRTLVTIPLYLRGTSLGFIGFDAVRHVKTWGADEINLLQVMAELFTNVEMRRRRELELIEARIHAEMANRSKSEFLANMSHEIRTPLHGIVGTLSLLRETTPTAEQSTYLSMMDVSVDSLMSIINDILDLSKMEAGKLVLLAVPFNLESEVHLAVETFKSKAHLKNLELAIDYPFDMPARYIGDGFRIRQILLNLVGNAVKFTDQGSISVHATYHADEQGEEVQLTVRDSGIGIPPNRLHMLFQPFEQADSSSSKQYEGTGLGLAICHHLVTMMHGSIRADSRLGEGSVFTLRLPLKPALDLQQVFMPSESIAGLTALVVDDNPINRRVLAQQLLHMGMKVETAEDGYVALQKVKQAAEQDKPFALAFIDYAMPGMDGLELGRRIGTMGLVPEMRMILATSVVGLLSPSDVIRAGFVETVSKPYPKSEIQSLIARLMIGTVADIGPLTDTLVSKPAINEHDMGESPLAGRRVLLVDDHDLNRRAAAILMIKKGLHVQEATSGRDAIRWLSLERFDLILMDIQMPGMDGYETTRRIRALPGEASRIPIIALTANALSSDRDRSLASGMNGYLTKPFRWKELSAALYNQIKPDAICHEDESAPVSNSSITTGVASHVLETVQQLAFDPVRLLNQFDGDMALSEEVLRSYLDELDGQLAELAVQIRERNEPGIRQAAHFIRGGSAYAAALRIESDMAAISSSAKAHSWKDCDAILDALMRDIPEIHHIMSNWLESLALLDHSAGGSI